MAGLSFLHPLLLLGLLALPVIWWLLRALPPAPRRVPFGGLLFLADLADQKDTPQHTPLWLLLLRLLAVALIIFGLAGPVLNAPQEEQSDGPLLIIVDDGWPAAPGWRDRQRAMASLALGRGAASREARILTTAGSASLSDPLLSGPLSLTAAARQIEGLVPKAALPDRAAALTAAAEGGINWSEWDILWLADGTIGRSEADRRFLRTLAEGQSLTVVRPPGQAQLVLRGVEATAAGLVAKVDRIGGSAEGGVLVATASDGRALAEIPFTLEAGGEGQEVLIDLPLSLRNEITRLSLQGIRSAGATWLVDSGARRVQAGLVTGQADSLLDGGFFIDQALTDRALVRLAPLEELMTADIGLIILDDIGTLRERDELALQHWVQEGGVLLRFAGPNTANAEAATGPLRGASYPVALRGGERAFGGALTWDEPQPIASFSNDSPFADIVIEEEVMVRRQVLTRPSGDTDHEVWARLADGTPLITARSEGRGSLILVHVTAAPTWSDLPISGLFPDLMARITRLAAGAPPPQPTTPLAPYRLLDGYGNLIDPPASQRPASVEALTGGSAPPGLYGAAIGGLAVNTYPEGAPALSPLTISQLPANAALRGFDSDVARAFGAPLLAIALGLFALDALLLALSHWRAHRQAGVAAALIAATVISFGLPLTQAAAQSAAPRPGLDPQAVEASLEVRFAYVITGDPQTDELSRTGLYGLTLESTRRSALEPGMPLGVDLERDDLSVYAFLYWPILPGGAIPSDAALSRLEGFMAGGGMLLIDTQDGERQKVTGSTPAGEQLRRILTRMNIPPLEPLPAGHVLGKSFYHLDDLEGRNDGGPVWVEAGTALRESTDGVPSLIIGGRDWAAAWAVDDNGRPLRPPGPNGPLGREYAYRAGINLVMVALTGNYKKDQVHVQEMLDRLGEQP